MKTPILLIALLLVAPWGPAPAAQRGEHNVYLTAKAEADMPLHEPATEFACRDKVYGVIEINRPGDSGQHMLYATWRNPSGDDQEVTKYPFQLIDGSARVWVWLRLHRSAESSLTQFMNPSGGLEEFAGEWELQVQIDDQVVARKKFQMLC